MQNPILYYLNHIPLLMTWTYCYNEILPVRKSYWRDYLALDLGITLVVFFLLSLYAIPGSAQDHSVVRMTVSAMGDRPCDLSCEASGLESDVVRLVCPAAAFDYCGNGDDADHTGRRAVQPRRV